MVTEPSLLRCRCPIALVFLPHVSAFLLLPSSKHSSQQEEGKAGEGQVPSPYGQFQGIAHDVFIDILCAKTEPRAPTWLQWSLGNVVFVPGDHVTQQKPEGSVAKEKRETGSCRSVSRLCTRFLLPFVRSATRSLHQISVYDPPTPLKLFWLLAFPFLKSFKRK